MGGMKRAWPCPLNKVSLIDTELSDLTHQNREKYVRCKNGYMLPW